MSTLKQAMLLDGQALSNNDPNMVITLKGADAAKVEITTIGNDSITYSFKEGVPTDTLYDLSLSFVYKELYSLDIPLSLINLGTVKDWRIEAAPISTKCWARGESLPFKVIKNEVDITDQLLDVVFVPNGVVKAGDTGAKSWTIESETAFAEQTVKISYTYRLPDDLPEVSRQFTGDFVIAAYDGQELEVTPVTDPIRIPVGSITPVKFKIKFRNYRDSTSVVRYIQASSTTAPINYASQELKVAEQEIWVSFGAPSSYTGEGTLVFGTSGVNSILGKNRVDLKMPMKAYEPGLIVNARVPSVLTGKQNQEVEQTITISMDGDKLSMEDVTIEIANPARLSVVSKVGKVVTFKILDANDTVSDINNFTNITYSYGGLSTTQMQSIIIKPRKQVTVTPDNISHTLPKGSLFSSDIVISDGDGTVFDVTDPRVTISVQSGSSTYAQFVDKYDGGFISKLTYSGGSNIAIIQYDVKVTGVPGSGLVTSIVTIAAGGAVTDCKYAQAGSLSPNQETVVMNNKYQIGDADVTVDKVLLTKYVNNPSTGNAIIELLDKPTTTNNIGFGRNVKTGWTGALAEMTEYVQLPGGSIVYKATGNQQVAQAAITANVLNNTFRYTDGVKTDIFVTLSQERIGQADWNFATSTDIRNIVVSGTVKAATVVNSNGTFTISVTGNGSKGAGAVTFSVVEGNVHYPKRIELEAIDNFSVVINPGYETVYGMANTDIEVKATVQMNGVNLGNVITVTTDHPTITLKSSTTAGGTCTVVLTSPADTELQDQTVNLKYEITSGNEGVGLIVDKSVNVNITSKKFIVYNLPHFFEGQRFAIGPGLNKASGNASKVKILKDGKPFDPMSNDLLMATVAGKDAWTSEIVGIDATGTVYVKIRNDTTGIKENFIVFSLISDPTYTYGGVDTPESKLELNGLTGAALNSNLNFDAEVSRDGALAYTVSNQFREGLSNNPINGTLIWYRKESNPVEGDAFFNKDTAKVTQGAGSAYTMNLETGHTGGYAKTIMLHLGSDGMYRNGATSIPVKATPVKLSNNTDATFNSLNGAKETITLGASQITFGNGPVDLTGYTLVSVADDHNLVTFSDFSIANSVVTLTGTGKGNPGRADLVFSFKDVNDFQYTGKISIDVVDKDTTVITPIEQQVTIFQSGNNFPFTVADDTGDISGTITGISFAPTSNITKETNGDWYINKADKDGQTLSLNYTFTYVTHGSSVTKTVAAKYVVAPWDGVYMSLEVPDYLTMLLNTDKVFTVPVTYHQKPGADKVNFVLGPNATSVMQLVSAVASPDKTYLTVTVRAGVANSTANVVFAINDKKVPSGWVVPETRAEAICKGVVSMTSGIQAFGIGTAISGKFGEVVKFEPAGILISDGEIVPWDSNLYTVKYSDGITGDWDPTTAIQEEPRTAEGTSVRIIKPKSATGKIYDNRREFAIPSKSQSSGATLVYITVADGEPAWVDLELGADFQTSIEGNITNPVTVTQSVVKPT